MAKCSICARPVVAEPHVLATGQLVHEECRARVFRPRERPKRIGTLPRPQTTTGTLGVDKQGSGSFGGARPRVALFIAAGEDGLRMYQAFAAACGLDVELARDGHEAVLLAQLARPEVIVLDLCDGDLDGAWILGRLKGDAATRSRPLVVVGWPPGESAECLGGLDAYAVKAGDPLEVLRAVERVLAKPQVSGAKE